MIKVFIVFVMSCMLYGDYYFEYGKKVELTPVKDIRSLECCDGIKTYKTRDGSVVKFKNEIVVKLKQDIDADTFFKKYAVTDIKKISKDTYIVIPDVGEDLLKLSQKMYIDTDTLYAIPNKIKQYKKR